MIGGVTVDGSAREVDSVNLTKKQHLPMLVKLLDEGGFVSAPRHVSVYM